MTDPFALDTDLLSDYLSKHISEFAGPLTAEKFVGGQSNPTYLLSTPKQKYVLRRKPPGTLLPGAHAVDREHTILSALFPTPLPVAEPLHLCQDDDIIGSDFYVMEFKQGRILWDPTIGKQWRGIWQWGCCLITNNLHGSRQLDFVGPTIGKQLGGIWQWGSCLTTNNLHGSQQLDFVWPNNWDAVLGAFGSGAVS